MQDLTSPNDSSCYLDVFDSIYIKIAYRKNNLHELHDSVCIDVLPGFDVLPKELQDEAISRAFTNIARYIENEPVLYGTPSTAMICISYVKHIDGQTIVHLITASAAGCNIYYAIKDKMETVKSYQRLNNNVYKDYSSGMQKTSDAKYNNLDVPKLVNSFKTIQIEHHEIPLAKDEAFLLLAAQGIRPVSLARSDKKQGDDAKNIAIAYGALMRGGDAAAHFVQHQSTTDKSLAITRTMCSSDYNSAPALIGVFNGYNGSNLSELLVQQLPDEIFSNSLNDITPQLQSNHKDLRSQINRDFKGNRLTRGSKFEIGNKNLGEIRATINSRANKITGLQEISSYFRGKYNIDHDQSAEYLQSPFQALLANIETVFFNQELLDIHKHNILDKYVLFIDKSDSWRRLIKELRELAFNWLKTIAEKCETSQEAINFLKEYRDHMIFSSHRANHWFQKIGRTQTVIEIDKLIENYKTRPRLVNVKCDL